MSERSVSVRLSANVDAYLNAMNRARSATMSTTQQMANISKVGGQLQSVGGQMSRYVTVPLAGVGVAATKMAMDFDSAFANMAGLADAPIDQIDTLKQSVLDLAGETGQAPMALAESLYAAMSSGLDAAQAMDAVDIAARGAAAGLGTSADIVSLVASATTSYADSNLTAADAVDILTQTIREGRADPDELAGSLGRILPVASQLGVSFDEVGAATAYLSNVFGDTNRTVTAMSGVMLKLLSPTQQGRKALDEYGLSIGQIQAAIDSDGLLGALELLRTSGLAGNSQALRALFDDVEAFQGITALLGADTETLAGIFDATANSTGALGEAFGVVADTEGFKMKQALAEIQVAMIKVGDVLLPIAGQIGSAIADLAGWFASLPGPVQEVVVALGGLAAAGGPVIWMAGTLLKNWQTLSATFVTGAGAMRTAVGALGAIGAAIAIGATIWQMAKQDNAEAKQAIDDATIALHSQTQKAWDNVVATGAAADGAKGLAIANQGLEAALQEIIEGSESTQQAMVDLNMTTADLLDVVMAFGRDPVEGLVALGAQLGYSEDRMRALAVVTSDGRLDWSAMYEGAEAAGFFRETVGALDAAYVHLIGRGDHYTDQLQQVARQEVQNLVTANELTNATVNQAAANLGMTVTTGDMVAILMEYNRIVGDMTPEQRAATVATDGMAASLEMVDPAAVLAAAGLDGVGAAAGDMAEMVDTASIDVRTAAQRMADEAQHFEDAWVDAIDSLLTSGMGLYDAKQQLWDVAQGFSDAIDDTSRSLEMNTAEGRQNADALQEWARGIAQHTQEMIDSGASAVDVANDYHHNREALLDNAEALGFNREEVEALLREWGLMPSLVSTTYQMAGIQTAMEQVQAMLDEIGELPPEVATEIQALIDRGKYDEAIAMLYALQNPIDVPVRPYLTRTMVYANGVVSTAGDRVTMRMAARGAYLDQPEVLMAGEAGPEVILPLTDMQAMKNLLGMPEVGPRVWAAFESSAGHNAPAPTAPSKTFNMENTFNVQASSDEHIARVVARKMNDIFFRVRTGAY